MPVARGRDSHLSALVAPRRRRVAAYSFMEFFIWNVSHFFHSGKGPIWSEGLILALALIGILSVFTGKNWTEGNRNFIRFLALYTIILTVIYSAISYKTPWCLLSFWNGMILLAGVGARDID